MSNSNMKPMNLLFICSDHHSREKYGAYGNSYVKTPNLDKLAANGTIFKNAYCNFPICVPSRASMTIGDYAHKYSYWDNGTAYKGDQEGFGHRLSQQGYKITTIGKLHYKGDMPETGFPDQRIPLHLKDGKGNLTQGIRDGSIKRLHFRDHILKAGAGDSEYIRYDAAITDQAVNYLKNEATSEGKPWVLYCGFICPHWPLIVPKEYIDIYRPFADKIPFPKQFRKNERPMHPILESFRQQTGFDADFTDDEVMNAVAAYYGMVTYLDEQVGKVLDALHEAGLDQTTRIIYTTDHGDQMGDHGLFFKHCMYEGAAGVPLVIAGPDVPKGKVVEQNASLIDIFPTVLECVGAEFKTEDKIKPGQSLWKMAKGEINNNRAVFAEYHAIGINVGTYMLRKGDYKLIYYAEGYSPQLFDLKNDPDELVDLASNINFDSVVKDLIAELYKVCDPEKINIQAKTEQLATLEANGGRDAVLKNVVTYSPAPKEFH